MDMKEYQESQELQEIPTGASRQLILTITANNQRRLIRTIYSSRKEAFRNGLVFGVICGAAIVYLIIQMI